MLARLVVESTLFSPPRLADKREQVDRVRAAIERLNPVDSEILLLRYFEDLKNLEAAEELELSEPAASLRFSKAKARLAEIPRRETGEDTPSPTSRPPSRARSGQVSAVGDIQPCRRRPSIRLPPLKFSPWAMPYQPRRRG